MRIWNLLIVMLCLSATSLTARDADTLNVMTYNLRFGELASLEEMAAFINGVKPDLVALQECDWKTTRERAPQQNGKTFVNELAYFTEMFGIYGKAIDYKRGYYGVGILSRYPIVRSERIFLPNPEPKTEQRVLLVADIELPNKTILTFACTHLEVSSAKVREAQIQFINEWRKNATNPVVLAGDLNAIPSANEIKNGFSDWRDMTNAEFTFSTVNPRVKIDYIYGYPEKKMEMISTQVHTESLLSDHFPVSSLISIIY